MAHLARHWRLDKQWEAILTVPRPARPYRSPDQTKHRARRPPRARGLPSAHTSEMRRQSEMHCRTNKHKSNKQTQPTHASTSTEASFYRGCRFGGGQRRTALHRQRRRHGTQRHAHASPHTPSAVPHGPADTCRRPHSRRTDREQEQRPPRAHADAAGQRPNGQSVLGHTRRSTQFDADLWLDRKATAGARASVMQLLSGPSSALAFAPTHLRREHFRGTSNSFIRARSAAGGICGEAAAPTGRATAHRKGMRHERRRDSGELGGLATVHTGLW